MMGAVQGIVLSAALAGRTTGEAMGMGEILERKPRPRCIPAPVPDQPSRQVRRAQARAHAKGREF